MTTVLNSASHRFALEILGADGARLHDAVLEKADFERAVEATFFEALRRGVFREYAVPSDRASIEPLFPGAGALTNGFEIVLPEARQRFGLDYFHMFVRRTGAGLLVGGQIDTAAIVYRLSAFVEEAAPKRRGGLVFDLAADQPSIPIREGSLYEHGLRQAWGALAPGDFPVLLPRHVVEEAVAEARRAPEREVGGVLLGHLQRDRETDELFLLVTCLVPCEQTEATAISVTFTHDTWQRVREVASWRGEGELIVGWVHSHPFRLCAECPNPVPAECQAKVLFYSSDDEFLMELTFPRPFMVGLLAAVEPRLGQLPVKLFGWKNGRVVPRGFEVIEG